MTDRFIPKVIVLEVKLSTLHYDQSQGTAVRIVHLLEN